MVSHPSQPSLAVGALSALQRRELLQGLAEIASNLANKQLDTFATRLADALLRAAAVGAGSQEAQLRLKAAGMLKKNRYPFYYVVSERLAAVLQHEAQALDDASVPTGEAGSAKPLSPDMEVDKKLSFIKASRAIENEHAERLTALNIRLASLLGRDELSTAHNPFRPQVFLAAIHDAWCEFNPDAEAHHLVFRLLGPELCIDLGPILHALNTELVRRGILPKLVNPPRAMAPAPASEESGADPLTQQLRRLFPVVEKPAHKNTDRPLEGALPALFGDTYLNANLSRDQLFAYLAEIQKNGPAPHQAGAASGNVRSAALLAHVKRWAPPDMLSQADASAIDLLIQIFEAILNDQGIPAEIQTLIGSLQIPVLKATLTDKDFFFSHTHPARHVIELLAQLGVGWDCKKGPADPLYQTILRNVKRIQSDQRAGSFSDAVADLDAFLDQEECDAAQALSVSIAQALDREKRLQASKAARHDVALRIGSGEVVAFVETFLEDKWVSVLTLAYTVKDDKPQALDSAIKTMDDLCWSVKPKITMDERKNLIAKLPGIVAMLNKWLDLIKWTDAARTKFFDDLAKCHASIVRAPLELSPERQMQIAVAVAKKAAERRLARQAAQQPEPVPDAFDEKVQQLKCGSWIEFTDQGGAMKVRLAWASPNRSFFIFSTRDKPEALAISDEALAQAMREGRAQVVLEAGLVGRALAQALASANSDMRISAA